MNNKSYMIIGVFILSLFVLVIEIGYLFSNVDSEQKVQKYKFVQIIGLPDLAFMGKGCAQRHRSLSTTFDAYPYDPSLRENTTSSFIYSQGDR